MGPTAFQILDNQDTIFQKIDYELYSKKEIKNPNFKYVEIIDLLTFDVAELKSTKLSKSGFDLMIQYCNDTDLENINSDENRYELYKEVFFEYIGKLYDEKQYDEAFRTTDFLLEKSDYFTKSTLLAFNITAFRVAFESEIWEKSKKYALNTLSLLENDNNFKILAKLLQAQLCEVYIALDENDQAQKLLNELEEFKDEIKSDLKETLVKENVTEEEAENLLTYYDYNYRLANLYFLLKQNNKAKDLLQEIISETNKIEQAGYFFMKTYELSESSRYLLDEIKLSDE